MEALFRLFANICRLRQGPESVPFSYSLFIVLFIVNFIIEIALGFTEDTFSRSAYYALFSVILLLIYTWGLLFLFRFGDRYLQTITSLLGVSLFTNIVCFVPLIIVWKMGFFAEASYNLIKLLLIIWILSIYAHIYRSALNISFFLGFALAMTYLISFILLANNLFGV